MKKLTKKTTVREVLQQVGTEFGRSFAPNIWVNALMSEYKPKALPIIKQLIEEDKSLGLHESKQLYLEGKRPKKVVEEYPKWIITDLRFPNEFEAVKDRGGITIRVNRPKLLEPTNSIEGYIYAKNILKEKYGIETSEYPDEVSIKGDSNLYNNLGLKEEYREEFNTLVNSYIKPIIKEHPSETALDNETRWDYVINNDSTIEDLIKKVREILNKENII